MCITNNINSNKIFIFFLQKTQKSRSQHGSTKTAFVSETFWHEISNWLCQIEHLNLRAAAPPAVLADALLRR